MQHILEANPGIDGRQKMAKLTSVNYGCMMRLLDLFNRVANSYGRIIVKNPRGAYLAAELRDPMGCLDMLERLNSPTSWAKSGVFNSVIGLGPIWGNRYFFSGAP